MAGFMALPPDINSAMIEGPGEGSLMAAGAAMQAVGGALAARDGKVLYRFVGQMQSAPAGSTLTVSVVQGNRAALRSMLGLEPICM